jgi:hypothetical protein
MVLLSHFLLKFLVELNHKIMIWNYFLILILIYVLFDHLILFLFLCVQMFLMIVLFLFFLICLLRRKKLDIFLNDLFYLLICDDVFLDAHQILLLLLVYWINLQTIILISNLILPFLNFFFNLYKFKKINFFKKIIWDIEKKYF